MEYQIRDMFPALLRLPDYDFPQLPTLSFTELLFKSPHVSLDLHQEKLFIL
jgi:hypothetical protein